MLLCVTTAGRGTSIGGRRASPPPCSVGGLGKSGCRGGADGANTPGKNGTPVKAARPGDPRRLPRWNTFPQRPVLEPLSPVRRCQIDPRDTVAPFPEPPAAKPGSRVTEERLPLETCVSSALLGPAHGRGGRASAPSRWEGHVPARGQGGFLTGLTPLRCGKPREGAGHPSPKGHLRPSHAGQLPCWRRS